MFLAVAGGLALAGARAVRALADAVEPVDVLEPDEGALVAGGLILGDQGLMRWCPPAWPMSRPIPGRCLRRSGRIISLDEPRPTSSQVRAANARDEMR